MKTEQLRAMLKEQRDMETKLLETLKGTNDQTVALAALSTVMVTVGLVTRIPKDQFMAAVELCYDRLNERIGDKIREIP